MPDRKTEILERPRPARRRPLKARQFAGALAEHRLLDSRLLRFVILVIVAYQFSDTTLLEAYFFGAAVYGWTATGDALRYLREYLPHNLYVFFTLQGMLILLLLAFVTRFVLALLIGWLVMPLSLGLGLRRALRQPAVMR